MIVLMNKEKMFHSILLQTMKICFIVINHELSLLETAPLS